MKLPTISIIIATLNSERTLDACLTSIREQSYPQRKVEIILVDGGSTDATKKIGHKHNAVVITKRNTGAEAAKAYGLKKATGELIADFGSDNILPDKHWMRQMIIPLVDNSSIIASYPQRYTYREEDSIFNRYVALFGVNDPVPFYMNKADRQSWLYDDYALAGHATPQKNYYDVIFTPDDLPTVGANGFLIRTHILKKARVDPDYFFHIDVIHDVVCQGYSRFAVVDTSVIHDTADTLWSLVTKRDRYFRELYLDTKSNRRYHVVNTSDIHDLGNLFLFVVYAITIIQPLFLSIRGYIKKPDIAWFVHPVFCICMVYVYGRATVAPLIKRLG